jgi:hypothetical protein
LNKGLEIRNAKLQKQLKKRNTIKPEQENICVFITIRYEVIERINGKFKHMGNHTVNGLQIKNRVYLNDGSYKLINSHSVKILKRYEEITEWANEELIERYNAFLAKLV